MEDSNATFDEWRELAEVQFKEKMYKNLATCRKDENRYKRHLSAIKEEKSVN